MACGKLSNYPWNIFRVLLEMRESIPIYKAFTKIWLHTELVFLSSYFFNSSGTKGNFICPREAANALLESQNSYGL